MMRYQFTWDLIGDIAEGRANLGDQVGVDVYRLMQFTLRAVIEEKYGTEVTDEIFFAAGKIAGTQFYEHAIMPVASLNEFVSKTQAVLKEKKIGILRIETVSEEEITLTVDEDLDCSGLPQLDFETCVYDEGFISGLFESFTGQAWIATEIDCWCTGARTCRFSVVLKKDADE
ncbi:MAG: 4-vinyl reductase [Eggerthellaceae bacterium]|nr:4-vinyl reductase [Eggerthellaceae bacterium]